MSVSFIQAIAQWGAANPAVSRSFTANAGDVILAAGENFSSGSSPMSFSGTGTYSLFGSGANDADGDTWAIGYNASATAGAQTTTVTSQASDTTFGWGLEYSGVGSVSGAMTDNSSPGTGTGAVKGVSVIVPTGGILVAICTNVITSTGTVTSPSGTNRGSGQVTGTLGGTYAEYFCITEYAGAGAAVQPTFTVSDGSECFVVQWLLTPSSGGTSISPSSGAAVLTGAAPSMNLGISPRTARQAWEYTKGLLVPSRKIFLPPRLALGWEG